jgi:hypothetical protein
MPNITEEATGSSITRHPTQETPVVRSTVNTHLPGAPRLTKSMKQLRVPQSFQNLNCLVKYDLKRLWILIPTMQRLWRDWKQSRKVTTEALESL